MRAPGPLRQEEEEETPLKMNELENEKVNMIYAENYRGGGVGGRRGEARAHCYDERLFWN